MLARPTVTDDLVGWTDTVQANVLDQEVKGHCVKLKAIDDGAEGTSMIHLMTSNINCYLLLFKAIFHAFIVFCQIKEIFRKE